MAFIKDTLDKIILGRWRFLNLQQLTSNNIQSLAIDENGNLGIGSGDSGEITELESRVSDVESQLEEISPLAESAVQPDDLSDYATTAALTSGLAGKANTSHIHTISQVTNLQTTLDNKANTADLGTLSAKDAIAVPTDITATGTASATTYLRGDGSWATPTNTTYTNMTQAEADAGTVTTGRTISALVLETKINNKIASKLTADQGVAVADAVDDTDVVAQFNSLLASLRTAGIIAT